MRKTHSGKIVDAQTTTGAGPKHHGNGVNRTFQAVGRTTAGAGSVTIKVQATDVFNPTVDGQWIDLGTITLGALTTTDTSDGFATEAPWLWVRGNVTAIAGTGASVDLWMGV